MILVFKVHRLPPFLERLRPASDARVPSLQVIGTPAGMETATLRPRKAPRAGRVLSDYPLKPKCSLTYKSETIQGTLVSGWYQSIMNHVHNLHT